jgi:hypothetical protein
MLFLKCLAHNGWNRPNDACAQNVANCDAGLSFSLWEKNPFFDPAALVVYNYNYNHKCLACTGAYVDLQTAKTCPGFCLWREVRGHDGPDSPGGPGPRTESHASRFFAFAFSSRASSCAPWSARGPGPGRCASTDRSTCPAGPRSASGGCPPTQTTPTPISGGSSSTSTPSWSASPSWSSTRTWTERPTSFR